MLNSVCMLSFGRSQGDSHSALFSALLNFQNAFQSTQAEDSILHCVLSFLPLLFCTTLLHIFCSLGFIHGHVHTSTIDSCSNQNFSEYIIFIISGVLFYWSSTVLLQSFCSSIYSYKAAVLKHYSILKFF